MATYSIAEAREHLPDLLDRAAGGEEIVVLRDRGTPVVLRPVPGVAGMTPEDRVGWFRARRVTPLDPSWDGSAEIRRMRDGD